MQFTQMTGKKHFIVGSREGIGGVEQLAKDIEDKTVLESRATGFGPCAEGWFSYAERPCGGQRDGLQGSRAFGSG